jgi:ATP-dependent helicase/nuclease subunit B
MRVAVELELFSPFLESGQLILTPGRRLARDILSTWAKHCSGHSQVVLQPAVEPVDSWLEREWREAVEDGRLAPRQLLTTQQELALWQQVIRDDLSGRDGFTLTHPRAAAVRAQSAWNKLLMHGGTEVSDLWSYFQYDDDCQVFAAWATLFMERLGHLQVETRYSAYRQLLSLPISSRRAAGLYVVPELPPLTSEALHHLADIKPIEPPRNGLPTPQVTAFATRQDELASAAKWAKRKSVREASRIGIVLLDMAKDRYRLEYFLRREFDCLGARYNDLPVNFSTGMPLADTPLFRDALTALEWEVRALSRADWLSLMRSPYLPAHHEEQMGLELIAAQFQIGTADVSLESTLHLSTQIMPASKITKILRTIRSSRDQKGVKSLQDWSELIRKRLLLWRWPSRHPLDSVEYQQLQHLEPALDALAELSSILPHQSFEAALSLWRDCLTTTVFQPKTPFDSIQILGPLEAVGGRFDALWICGAQQGIFPTRRRIEPFIPTALQKKLGFADYDSETLSRQAKTLLAVWRAGSEACTVSFHRYDEDLPAARSPLIQPTHEAADVSWFPPLPWQGDSGTELMPVDRAAPIAAVMENGGATHIGGATLIRDQAACSFRAFVVHRLQPRSLSPAVMGFSPAERGALLHDVMFRVWKSLERQAVLHALDAKGEQALIAAAVSQALMHLDKSSESRGFSIRDRVGHTCWELEQEACSLVVTAWLQLEKQREVDFSIVELEQTHTLDLNGLQLTLRPDRIDECSDGRRLVIDYKTHAPAKTRWIEERPGEPQLPLYALLDHSIQGVAFAAVASTESMKFVALGEDLGLGRESGQSLEQQTSGKASHWQDMVSHWHLVLRQLADEFLAGAAVANPSPGACRYCDLAPLCRITQLNTASAGFAEDARE